MSISARRARWGRASERAAELVEGQSEGHACMEGMCRAHIRGRKNYISRNRIARTERIATTITNKNLRMSRRLSYPQSAEAA
jgi:hypothetical protein